MYLDHEEVSLYEKTWPSLDRMANRVADPRLSARIELVSDGLLAILDIIAAGDLIHGTHDGQHNLARLGIVDR